MARPREPKRRGRQMRSLTAGAAAASLRSERCERQHRSAILSGGAPQTTEDEEEYVSVVGKRTPPEMTNVDGPGFAASGLLIGDVGPFEM